MAGQSLHPTQVAKIAGGAILVFLLVLGGSSSTYVFEPGHRGVLVTLGKVSPVFRPEGFGLELPFISRVEPQLVRRQTASMEAACYSSDLPQVVIDVEVLCREKIGSLLILEDVMLKDTRLTRVLENAIEAKMVQEQEAARAQFSQQQAEIEAETLVIQAKGEADAIRLQGMALRENPSVLDLQIVGRWDGITPAVVGSEVDGVDLLLPLGRIGDTNLMGGVE